eukprot:m.58664 g.58664  ORF g.58664 m.58664 type:complete len:281 (+) comp11192_c0_seq3:259-1101(+)
MWTLSSVILSLVFLQLFWQEGMVVGHEHRVLSEEEKAAEWKIRKAHINRAQAMVASQGDKGKCLAAELEHCICRRSQINCKKAELVKTPAANSYQTPGLVTLILTENHIEIIEEGAFDGLSTVINLGLQHNHISKIEPGAFKGLTSLETVGLYDNMLPTITRGIFVDVPNLLHLGISDNKITSLEDGAFDGLHKLQYLTMQRNQISTIHAQAFTGATKIRSIRMDENSLGCSGLQDFLQLQIPVFERFSNLNAEKNQASTECVEELQHSALGTKVPRLLL